MGWFTGDGSAPKCEGYVVGFIRDATEGNKLKELAYPTHDKSVERVDMVQVACECGWRSPFFYTSTRTDYHPYSVNMPEEWREAAGELWSEHVKSLGMEAEDPTKILMHRALKRL